MVSGVSRLIRFARFSRAAGVLALLAALAGCGRRGELEPPVDASAVQKPASSDSAEPTVHKKIPPITPMKTPFVLDPLLSSGAQ
jgi:predicted small lipoprotein YifL